MRLALLSPIHGQSIDHIARQLENYRTFLTPFKLRHFLHLSLESSASLQHELLDYADQHGHDIVFTQHRRRTWRHCTANALKELISAPRATLNHIIPFLFIPTQTCCSPPKSRKSFDHAGLPAGARR